MRGEGEKEIVTSLHPVCVWCHSTLARATSGHVCGRGTRKGEVGSRTKHISV